MGTGEVVTTFTISDDPQVEDMQMCAIWSGDTWVTTSLSGVMNVLDRNAPEKPKEVIEGHRDKVSSIAMDAKSGKFYSADAGGKVCMWQACKATRTSGVGHGGKAITALALSHDGATLVSLGLDDKISYNSTEELKFADKGVSLGKAGKALCCGRVSDILAVATSNSVLIFKGQELASTIETSWKPTCLGFSMDDTMLAVGGSDYHL